MSQPFDPYYVWLGIPPKDQPPHYYRLLAIDPFESNPEVIRDAATQRMAHVRTYQLGPHGALSQKILNELAAAKACLTDSASKARYDASLRLQSGLGPAAAIAAPATSDLTELFNFPRPTARPRPARSAHLAIVIGAVFGVAALAVGAVFWFRPPTLTPAATRGGAEQVAPASKRQSLAASTGTSLPNTDDHRASGSSSGGPEVAARRAEATREVEPRVRAAPARADRSAEGQASAISEARLPSTGKLPKEIACELGSGIRLELLLIPAGTFMMGDDRSRPMHQVNITRSFYLGKYEMTQEQWQAVMGDNPSRHKSARNPVEQVSWNDCQAFIDRLNAGIDADAGKFVLPTEAQWEYACRAGTTTRYFFGDDKSELAKYVWCAENSESMTHPVGQKAPNPWGLYDMPGNVWEWCSDWFGPDYYATSPTDDPPGPDSGIARVVRGNSWHSWAGDWHSALRHHGTPDARHSEQGFRVAFEVASERQILALNAVDGTPSLPVANPSGSQAQHSGKAVSALPPSGTIPEIIDCELRLPRSGSPYKLLDRVKVTKTGALLIERGTTVLAAPDAAIFASGILNSYGDGEELVQFRAQSTEKGFDKISLESGRRHKLEGFDVRGANRGLHVADNAAAEIRGCMFIRNQVGVETRRTPQNAAILLENCLVADNASDGVTLYLNRVKLDHCTISGNRGIGIHMVYYGQLTAVGCSIAGNKVGVSTVVHESRAEITSSNIQDNRMAAIEVATEQDLECRGNFWGTSDPEKIAASLIDGLAKPGRGVVVFKDFQASAIVGVGSSFTTPPDLSSEEPAAQGAGTAERKPKTKREVTGVERKQPSIVRQAEDVGLWLVTGPFLYDSVDKAYDDPYPIEKGPVDITAKYGTGKAVHSWKSHDGVVTVNKSTGANIIATAGMPRTSGVAVYYAVCWVRFPASTEHFVTEIRCPSAYKTWFDGKPRFGTPKPTGIPAFLGPEEAGDTRWHEILVKMVIDWPSAKAAPPLLSFHNRYRTDAFGRPRQGELPVVTIDQPLESGFRSLPGLPRQRHGGSSQ